MAREEQGGFAISTSDERTIEDWAHDKFGPKYGEKDDRRNAMRAGVVDREGNITQKGWDILSQDAQRLERNALAWMKKKFISVRDEGHDGHGDLVGSFWYDPSNPAHAALIDLALNERIDMTDSSYGDLADSVWSGVSRWGSSLLTGQINFFDIDEDVKEAIQDTLDQARKASRDRRQPTRRRSRARRTH